MDDASEGGPDRHRLTEFPPTPRPPNASPTNALPTNASFGPESPIMRPQSFHRGENCAHVAIPLISTGGCRAVSAGALAGPLRVTPAAVLKWFGSTAQMWEQLADALGRRWYSYLDAASRLRTNDVPTVPFADSELMEAVALFLPLTGNEIEWTRVWLSMLEHGRHHELVGRRLAEWEAQEMEALHRATTCRAIGTLTATMVEVRGLRQMVAATHAPLSLDTAHDLLRRHVEQTCLGGGGIPEPAGDADALPSTRRFTVLPGLPGAPVGAVTGWLCDTRRLVLEAARREVGS